MKKHRLVLVGGGHSHVIVLQLWAKNGAPDTELILVSDTLKTTYSGMLPGFIAGYYTVEQIQIDLERLARHAGATFIQAKVTDLNLKKREVLCTNGLRLPFDFLSLNVGSQPSMANIPGACEWATGVKPLPQFLQHWKKFCNSLQHDTLFEPKKLVIVGGGAGGTELALNIQSRFGERIKICIVHKGSRLLPSHISNVGRYLDQELKRRKIEVYYNQSVIAVKPKHVALDSGLMIDSDEIIWTTEASSPPWIVKQNLAHDDKGFLLVSDTLQIMGQEKIFAAGDCATVYHQPRPKAGVYAVRQGPFLYRNLLLSIQGKRLKRLRLQHSALAMIGTGGGRAIAFRGWFFVRGRWVWKWKQYLDQKFMASFSSD